MKTVFSGIQPTGELHLGNYLGAVRNWVALQDQYRCIFCIVYYHGLTQEYDAKEMPKRVSEMVILITAREWTQQFEWTYHYRHATEAGLAREIADAIGEGRRPPKMAEDEIAAYEFAIELHNRRSVSDATYARALALFGERGVIDLTGICGYYSFLAMMMNVARTPAPADSGDAKPLAKFPS